MHPVTLSGNQGLLLSPSPPTLTASTQAFVLKMTPYRCFPKSAPSGFHFRSLPSICGHITGKRAHTSVLSSCWDSSCGSVNLSTKFSESQVEPLKAPKVLIHLPWPLWWHVLSVSQRSPLPSGLSPRSAVLPASDGLPSFLLENSLLTSTLPITAVCTCWSGPCRWGFGNRLEAYFWRLIMPMRAGLVDFLLLW